MWRIRRFAAAVSLTVILIGLPVGFYSKDSLFGRYRAHARLHVPSEALDLGLIWDCDQIDWTLPITNVSSDTVQVESFATSCGCLIVEPQAFVLAPGKTQESRITIDLASAAKGNDQINLAISPKLKPSVSRTNDRDVTWQIKASIKRLIDMNRLVYVGRHSVLSQPLQTIDVPFRALSPAKSVAVACRTPGFEASLIAGGPDGHFILQLKGTAIRPEGDFAAEVALTPILYDKALSPRSMTFRGTIVSDVDAEPSAIQVGGRQLGDVIEETVSLRSLTGRVVPKAHLEARGEGLTIEPLANGYKVRQAVCRLGAQQNEVRFKLDLVNTESSISFPVSYIGIDRPTHPTKSNR